MSASPQVLDDTAAAQPLERAVQRSTPGRAARRFDAGRTADEKDDT